MGKETGREMCFFKRNKRTEDILGRWEGREALGPRPRSPVLLAESGNLRHQSAPNYPPRARSPTAIADRDVKGSK